MTFNWSVFVVCEYWTTIYLYFVGCC